MRPLDTKVPASASPWPLAALERRIDSQDETIVEIVQAIRQLMAAPPQPRARWTGAGQQRTIIIQRCPVRLMNFGAKLRFQEGPHVQARL